MSFVDDEIASQPACWRRAAELARKVGAALPVSGERVAVVGCGTSWYMAQAYAALREAYGEGESDAFAASEMPEGRGYDRVLALTRSGTTTEVMEVLKDLRGTVPTVAITGDGDAPASALADEAVVLDFADERSVVQTRFPTAQLALLRAHLGDDLGRAARDAKAALAEAIPGSLVAAEQVTFLGRGWTCGLVQEAALKMREMGGAWAEAYPAMEYRHGPIAVAGPGRAAWFVGEPPEGLADEVAATGATVVRSAWDPMAELVRVQRLAVAVARARKLDPDAPRHLARSVILDRAGEATASP